MPPGELRGLALQFAERAAGECGAAEQQVAGGAEVAMRTQQQRAVAGKGTAAAERFGHGAERAQFCCEQRFESGQARGKEGERSRAGHRPAMVGVVAACGKRSTT